MNIDTINFLDRLSDKLGTTTDKLYRVLIKQTKLDAVISVIHLLFVIAVMIALYNLWQFILPYCKPVNPNAQYSFEREWPIEVQFCVVGLGVASVACTIFFIGLISDVIKNSITAFFNPEGGAIEKILSSIK